MQEDLKKIGLTWNEIKVYMSLLKLGETAVGAIVNDLKIHRQLVYDALSTLEKRDMVIKTMKNNIARFKLNDPKVIVENVRKQEALAERLSANIAGEMKKLKREHEINVYEGQNLIRKSLMDSIERMPKNGTYYILAGTAMQLPKTIGKKFFIDKYEKARTKKKLNIRVLAGKNTKEEFKSLSEFSNMKTRQVRFLPWTVSNPISTLIWDDCLHFTSYVENEKFVIELKNKHLRDTYLEHFKMLWELGKK